MNINLPFDYNSNIDDVNIVLMNNSLERIGNINCFQNFNCILNYNAADEISFDVYKYIDDIQCKYWEAIYDLKNVFVEELSEVFKIYISIDDSDQTIKHVIGRSLCEDELSNIKLYDVQINTASDILREDYTTPTVFCNENHKNSLLHRILEKAPHYSIEYVSPSLKNLQYTFEFDECSIYDALTEIGQKIGCIFKFNSLKRTISAYDLKNYCPSCNKRFDEKTDTCPYCNNTDIVKGDGNDTVITISKDSIASMTSLDNDEDSYINCLRIKTGDEMIDATVRNINPNGSEYIYYFNEDIINDMPDELVNKIDDYNEQNEYYNNEYVFDLDDNSLKNDYNSLVTKYNGDTYKNYKYDEDDEKVLQNNTFIDIDNNIIGFEKIIGLYYDNIDFQLYLESNLMPYVLQEDISIEEDIKNLTISNLSPISLSELSSYTSVSTIEIYIKKYASLYLKNSYIVEVSTQEYDFEGGREDGWNYGSWTGKIKLTEYGSEKKSLETSVLTLEINDNYQKFLDEKILTSLRSNDDEIGSIYNIMSIKDDIEFKNALKLYSLSRLISFEDAYQSGVDIMIEADQANASADFYQDIYVPLYNKLQYIKSERSLRENEVAIIERTQQRIEETKANIQESLNFEYYIGSDLWKIFCTYKREDVYTNDNITSEGLNNTEIIELARETINNAQENLKEIGYLQKNIVCSLKNFLGMKDFETYKEDFNLGNWIVCENDEVLFKQRLISINISISNDVVISVELSQVTRTEDELKDIKSVLNQASSLGATIGEIKNSIVQANDSSNIISSWIKDGLDLTNTKIVSTAKNQDIVYNKNGILVRSYDDITETYSPEQLKIVNSTIAITDDDWKTVKTAVGRFNYIDPISGEQKTGYGINSEVLVGNLMIGKGLIIKNSDNTFEIGDSGLIINTTSKTADRRLFRIQKDGRDKLFLDSNGNLIGNDITINNLIANSGSFNGKIVATSGNIGDWDINDGLLENNSVVGSSNKTTIIDPKNHIISFTSIENTSDTEINLSCVFSADGISYENQIFYKSTVTWDNSALYLSPDMISITDPDHGSSSMLSISVLSFESGATKTILINGGKGSITAVGSITGNTYISSSDRRLKENIKYIDLSSLVDDIKVCAFDFINGKKNNVGIIANDYIDNKYSKYFLTNFERDGTEYYGVNYQTLFMAAIQKIHLLERNIKDIQRKLMV